MKKDKPKNVKPTLKLDWATHKAAKFACENWHYSKRIPVAKLLKIGVWEDSKFIGVLIYGDGILGSGKTFLGIDKMNVAELVRVALTGHKTEVSKILSISLKFLKAKCPKIQLLVSFADKGQNHHGGIYQASNWMYTGETEPSTLYKHNKTGRIYHEKDVSRNGYTTKFGKKSKGPKYSDVTLFKKSRKHRYLYFVDKDLKKEFKRYEKSYPKRDKHSNDATGFQPVEGGAIPTVTLQIGES